MKTVKVDMGSFGFAIFTFMLLSYLSLNRIDDKLGRIADALEVQIEVQIDE